MRLTTIEVVALLVVAMSLLVTGMTIGDAYARYHLKAMIRDTIHTAIQNNPSVDIDELTVRVLQDVTEFTDGH